MRTSTKLFFIAIIFLLAPSCKKEEPVSTNTPGVFYFDGDIGTTPMYLEAGQNDYYMFSSYMQDANGVYNFRGELAPYSCNTCGNRLRITINDYTPTATNGFAQIGTSLAPGFFSYAFPGGAPTEFNVQFHSGATNGTPTSIDWDFGDGNTSTMTDPLHTYTRPGKYLVTMTVHFGTNVCISSYHVNVGIPDDACSGSFGSTATGNTDTFNVGVTGTGPFNFYWDFGDGNTTVSTASTMQHQYANPGVYVVKLSINDASGHITEFERHCATQNWTGPYADFYNNPTITSNPNYQYLSNVIIEWTDASGVSYTSNNPAQSSESYFKLSANDAYAANSNGQSTRKVRMHFECMLYSSTDSIPMSGEAVFAVAYH